MPIKGISNEDLPNSWECPSCCESGKNADYRVRREIKIFHRMMNHDNILFFTATFELVKNPQKSESTISLQMTTTTSFNII
jgi:hypothetical protein